MADHRHKREANARRMPRAAVIAGPLAVLATASAVTLGVLAGEPASSTDDVTAAASASLSTSASASASPSTPAKREQTVSRGAGRGELTSMMSKSQVTMSSESTRRAIAEAEDRLWIASTLNLWTDPTEKARQVGEIEAGEKVLVTGRELYGRDEIVVGGKSRWVTAGYLTNEEPFALGGDCTNGTSVPSGVSENVKQVHAAVCAAFPSITTYGTFRSDGEHGQGIAVDIMVSGDLGYQVAEFVREHYAELGVSYLIYSQRIWSVERSGEGWRAMSDRGSSTANHYDHVHVTTY
ncbi:mucin-2 protein [Nocardioides sp. cx-169]|uniref:mucin-2 protein n=1 Tax=Nocardioides sp. cx-169 TaxID=2899080 RepID=UPI001E532C96|nr:mucin-2 protein [Nocardioides sp. cx-169]MCD4534567.1 mucin-2 protein [Nocardioides sp. cx-169]